MSGRHQPAPLANPYATTAERARAATIDLVFSGFAAYNVFSLLAWPFGAYQGSDYAGWYVPGVVVAGLVVLSAVQVVGIARWGTTPGMRMEFIWVVDAESGRPPGGRKALRRWIRLAPMLLVPEYGGWGSARTAMNQGVHDVYAGTVVVRERPPKA